MNIALPRNLEDYVAELVRTSGYKGSDEVVLEALSEHQARRRGMEVVMTPELERMLDEGLENLDQATTTDELREGWCFRLDRRSSQHGVASSRSGVNAAPRDNATEPSAARSLPRTFASDAAWRARARRAQRGSPSRHRFRRWERTSSRCPTFPTKTKSSHSSPSPERSSPMTTQRRWHRPKWCPHRQQPQADLRALSQKSLGDAVRVRLLQRRGAGRGAQLLPPIGCMRRDEGFSDTTGQVARAVAAP